MKSKIIPTDRGIFLQAQVMLGGFSIIHKVGHGVFIKQHHKLDLTYITKTNRIGSLIHFKKISECNIKKK